VRTIGEKLVPNVYGQVWAYLRYSNDTSLQQINKLEEITKRSKGPILAHF